jgi:bifunctional DNA-binding transcriptional regulator/antitoxin component of YhaV-PrlF toxin-antitoxin module
LAVIYRVDVMPGGEIALPAEWLREEGIMEGDRIAIERAAPDCISLKRDDRARPEPDTDRPV